MIKHLLLIYVFLSIGINTKGYNLSNIINYGNTNIDSLIVKIKNIGKTHPDAVEFYITKALDNELKNNNTNNISKLFLFYGRVKNKEHNYDTALILFRKALFYAKQRHGNQYLPEIYLEMVNILYDYGNYKKCLDYLDTAEQLLSDKNYNKNLINILNNRGNIHLKLGEFDKADECFLRALNIAKKENDKLNISTAYMNLGIINRDVNQYSVALNYYDSALIYSKMINDSLGIAYIFQNMANILADFEKPVQALHYNLLAKQINDKMHIYNRSYAGLICNIGLNYAEQFKLDTALTYIYQSLKISEDVKDTFGIADTKITIGSILLEQKKYEEALKNIYEGMNLAKKIGAINTYISGYRFLIRYNKFINNYKKAFDLQLVYQQLLDSIRNIDRINNINELKTKYETEQKEQQIKLLESDNRLKQQEIKQKAQQRNWLIAIISVVLVLLLITFFYFKKIKSSKIKIEMLQREIHHRVKNNLSIIKRLVTVAKENTEDKTVHTELDELNSRIESMAKVHSQLYRKKDITTVDFKQYINELCNGISNMFKDKDFKLVIDVKPNINLDINKAIPLGLIINELLTNAYKHSEGENNKTVIRLSVEIKENNLIITVSDNGRGFPENFNLSENGSYGLKMVNGLILQLNGRMNLHDKNGAEFEIAVPLFN